jgi:MFS family permease
MGWKYIFLINLPIGIVLLALAAKYMKIEETRSSKLDLDWQGGVVLIIFIVSLMLFLGNLSSNAGIFVAKDPFFLLATLSLPAFVWIESHQKFPLLDLSIFRVKKFGSSLFSVGSWVNLYSNSYQKMCCVDLTGRPL